MATKYLRKIILEELRKVLNEFGDGDGIGGGLGYSSGTAPGLKSGGEMPQIQGAGSREGISMGKKDTKWLKSILPGYDPSFTFTPNFQNTRKHAKKVKSAMTGKSIIAGYKPCGNEMVGLTKGCMGKGVLKLQSFLKSAHDGVTGAGAQVTEPEIDGYFGPKTEAALNSFLSMAKEPKFSGATTDYIINVIIAPAVPKDFNQKYEAAYQQLVKDYVGQTLGQTTTKFDKAAKDLEAAGDPKNRKFNVTEPATSGPQDSDAGSQDSGPGNSQLPCPGGEKRGADGLCPGSGLKKNIDKTPLVSLQESLIRREIIRALKEL